MIAKRLVILLAACGGDDTMMTVVDAAAQSDSAPANCLVMADYGALGAKTGTAGTMGGVSATVTLDPGPPRDTFFLKMVSGKGAFAGGLNPGNYTITGADAQYLNCGLCVHIIADITASGPSKFYFADSGTVMLTSTSAPITGSATNLTFKEVDINSGAFVTGGCTSTIGSIELTAN